MKYLIGLVVYVLVMYFILNKLDLPDIFSNHNKK